MMFGEVLKEFKLKEGPEVLVPLIEDVVLRKALVAWPSVKIEFIVPVGDCEPEADEVTKWEWMWSRVKFNEGMFGVVAGLRGQDVSSVIVRLRGLRLIYPDGTINKLAQQYLRSIVASQLSKAKPKGKAEDPGQKK